MDLSAFSLVYLLLHLVHTSGSKEYNYWRGCEVQQSYANMCWNCPVVFSYWSMIFKETARVTKQNIHLSLHSARLAKMKIQHTSP